MCVHLRDTTTLTRYTYDICTSAPTSKVCDEISFRENFAKLATKRFLCFAKMRDEFREFRSFTKLPRLGKKQVLRKRRKPDVKIQNLTIFLLIKVKRPAKVVFGIAGHR
jgi:hypothetical protein